LTKEKRGLFGTARIKWNFTKFLVDRQGTVVRRYGPRTTPDAIAADIERLL
jgi:glutathione peroxidase